MKVRKNLLKILTLLILSGSIINAGYIKEKNTKTINIVFKKNKWNINFK